VRVTVTNTCEAAESYVLATFMDKAGGKELYYVGNTVKALKGGESQTQVFNLSGKNLPADGRVSVEVDPYTKVKEDVEGNNFRKLNPNVAPFPENAATHCKPKN
jgi:subtilase family serine protease